MKCDYLVVGSGIYGSVFAEQMNKKGKTCLVIDKRPHIAGNCYTEKVDDIDIHKFGCHIFNTHKKHAWDYLNKFSKFNNYRHTAKANYNNKIFSFPINMMTLHQLWGVSSPKEALEKLKSVKLPIKHPNNMEEWCLSTVGQELYETFIKNYSTKQWGKSPKELPASIIKRLPIRFTYNDDYYENSIYQGIPVNGYTEMISNMLEGIKVELNTDFSSLKNKWERYAKKLIYCGPIDEFYNYEFGKLEYRSLRWETKTFEGDYQGCSQMNFTDETTKFTRILEHKHFNLKNQKNTVVSWEYPVSNDENNDPYYPINDEVNNKRYRKYKKLANKNILITGRLGKYSYLDIDDCIDLALKESSLETL